MPVGKEKEVTNMDTREWENILKEKMSAYNIYEPSEDAIQFVRELLEKRTKEVIESIRFFSPFDAGDYGDFGHGYTAGIMSARHEYRQECDEILKHFGYETT